MTTKALKKEFGEGIFLSGDALIEKPFVTIPVSPAIDFMLGGGIPEGTLILFAGKPKLGKTVLALDFAATAQDEKYTCDLCDKRKVFYFNIEGRLRKRDLEGINHLKTGPDDFTVIGSEPGNILTGEKYIKLGEKLVHENPGCIFIFDSFSQLCTSHEMNSDIGGDLRMDAPRLLARLMRRLSNVIPVNKSIVIGINHMIANQGQGMAVWYEASGQKVQYQRDVKLKGTHFSPWNEGDKQIGQDVHWVCESSALGPPGIKMTSKLRYGHGIDKEAELVELAKGIGIIESGGAWNTLPDGTKFQGAHKTIQHFRDNPTVYDEIYSEYKRVLGI
jgi:recombination protein RecA